MGGNKKGSQIDTMPLLMAQMQSQQNTPDAIKSNLGILGKTNTFWDPNSKTYQSELQANPLLDIGVTRSLQSYLAMPQIANKAAEQAYNTYYDPIQREQQKLTGDYFSSMPSSARSNSRGIDSFARVSDELAENQSKKLYELGNQARNQTLNELSQQYNAFMNPYQNLASQSQNSLGNLQSARQSAMNDQIGLTNSLMSANSQNAQMRANKQSPLNAILGTAATVGSNFLGGKR